MTGSDGVGDFDPIRVAFELPAAHDTDRFPADVLAEAQSVAGVPAADLRDATDLSFVTIDPPGSRDLDQALLVERRGGGFRLHYAIADLGSVITAGGALDVEARRRGQTMYLPDGRVPLHPAVLSEGSSSLLPGEPRRAALWTIDLGADGEPVDIDVRRALVRSVAQFDYETVQAAVDAGAPHPSLEPLADLGRLRRQLAIQRGAIELELPEQEISYGDRGWQLSPRRRSDVDAWNAEMSLLTGMCAAGLMLEGKIGVLRTLPAPDPEAIAQFRRSARALGMDWPERSTPAEVLAGLDPKDPTSLALMTDATRLLRGAGYEAFDGVAPAQSFHGGIGAPYAHVTAPLRRLVDRFTTEVCLAVAANEAVPEWVREALPDLPGLMGSSDALAGKVDRACVDQVEAWLLTDRVDEQFEAVVLSVERDGGGGEVVLLDPPVVAHCGGADLPEGQRVTVRLIEADPTTRSVIFAIV